MLMFQAGQQLNRRLFMALGIPMAGLTGNLHGFVPTKPAKAKSVIVLFCGGGQSQLEMWDPKPDAPAEVRGAFSTINTKTPGLRFGEHMPQIARQSHRFTVLRSVSHDDTDHGSACYLSLTGLFHVQKSANPPPKPDDPPTLASIFRRLKPEAPFGFPSVHLNGPLLVPELPSPGQSSGYLGRVMEPLEVDPEFPERSLPALETRDELPVVRLQKRQLLRDALEQHQKTWEKTPGLLDYDQRYRQAYQLISNPIARSAFDLSSEPESVRNRYGRNRSGQSCLLARRLVEKGIPWITLFWNGNIRGQDKEPDLTDQYGWDTHNDIFEAMKDRLLPRFDQSFSALIEDLDQRGLLATTLVVCMGEFGRAPLVALEPRFAGATPGRKHWAAAYSVVFAGAGVQKGAILGATDAKGAYPTLDRVSPMDIHATIFDALGVDPSGDYHDLLNRPSPISRGSVISRLYS
ncbi:MAG: DUF1501 domain-containing protein [Gemmataceae bacterium]